MIATESTTPCALPFLETAAGGGEASVVGLSRSRRRAGHRGRSVAVAETAAWGGATTEGGGSWQGAAAAPRHRRNGAAVWRSRGAHGTAGARCDSTGTAPVDQWEKATPDSHTAKWARAKGFSYFKINSILRAEKIAIKGIKSGNIRGGRRFNLGYFLLL
jgi:hypothetical protein